MSDKGPLIEVHLARRRRASTAGTDPQPSLTPDRVSICARTLVGNRFSTKCCPSREFAGNRDVIETGEALAGSCSTRRREPKLLAGRLPAHAAAAICAECRACGVARMMRSIDRSASTRSNSVVKPIPCSSAMDRCVSRCPTACATRITSEPRS